MAGSVLPDPSDFLLLFDCGGMVASRGRVRKSGRFGVPLLDHAKGSARSTPGTSLAAPRSHVQPRVQTGASALRDEGAPGKRIDP